MRFANNTRGYLSGIGAGITWGFDTVMLGVAMAMAPFSENPVLVVSGAVICSALHDVFSALWLVFYMIARGRIGELPKAFCSRDGLFCALGALFGGPLAMTFYLLAIAQGGAALTASVTACYPIIGTALAVLILKEKTGYQTWIGLVICVIGICVLGYSPSDEASRNVIVGVLLALVTAVGWASEGVVCGYGMKDGNVDPQMALLIRELTSGFVYIVAVAPIFAHGFGNFGNGVSAIFACRPCGVLLAVTALIGMSSFGMWYQAISDIGAGKALCLNVTYSFWAVLITLVGSLVMPQYLGGQLSWPVAVGAVLMISGVTLATLYTRKGASV